MSGTYPIKKGRFASCFARWCKLGQCYGWLAAVCLLFGTGICMAQTYSVIGPQSNNQALLYIPDAVGFDQPVRIVMALHGMRQTPRMICNPLRPIADSLQAVLICPSGNQFEAGFIRSPLDERVHFSELLSHFTTLYPVVPRATILVGFSRGGTYAVETGLMYPQQFPNVVSMFGFYSPFLVNLLPPTHQQSTGLKVTLITGQTDTTLIPQTELATMLQSRGIPINLIQYPTLQHALPPDLLHQLKVIFEQDEAWLDGNHPVGDDPQ